MLNWRLIPVGLLALLLALRMMFDGFLSMPVFPHVEWLRWMSWFGLLAVLLLYASAWCITPGATMALTRMGKRGLILPIFFVAIFVGLLWSVDELWNHITPDTWVRAHLLTGFTHALFGGS